MAAKKSWIIITSGQEPLQHIAEQLEQKGFEVESTLDAIGQIIGQGEENFRAEAMKIKGVTEVVSSEENFNIGPPDAGVTW